MNKSIWQIQFAFKDLGPLVQVEIFYPFFFLLFLITLHDFSWSPGVLQIGITIESKMELISFPPKSLHIRIDLQAKHSLPKSIYIELWKKKNNYIFLIVYKALQDMGIIKRPLDSCF